MNGIETLWVDESIAYDGAQLMSHWILERFGLVGDAAVAFVGPCCVSREHMADVEDLVAERAIASRLMLHFLVEHFDADFSLAVWRQRVLIASMAEALNAKLGQPAVRRDGSDLYEGPNKLTVSIATATPASALIHAGINVVSEGTPVPTRGLADYGIEPALFASEMLERYAQEVESARRARCKARPPWPQRSQNQEGSASFPQK